MHSVSSLQVHFSLPARQTSAQKAVQLIDPEIRTGREEALTDLFNALRIWRALPSKYNYDQMSEKLNVHISDLNKNKSCSAIQLNDILKVALEFARANQGRGFRSNTALIAVLNEQKKGLKFKVFQEKTVLFLNPVLDSLNRELKKRIPKNASEEERQAFSKRQERCNEWRLLLREISKPLKDQYAHGVKISRDLPFIQKLRAALEKMTMNEWRTNLGIEVGSAFDEALNKLIKPYSNWVGTTIDILRENLEFYNSLNNDDLSSKERVLKEREIHNCSVLIRGFRDIFAFLSPLEQDEEKLDAEQVKKFISWLKRQKISLQLDIDAYAKKEFEPLTRIEEFNYENLKCINKTIESILPLLQAQVPEQERTGAFGSRFFSTALKVAGLGMLLISGGLSTYLAFKPSDSSFLSSAPVSNGLQPAPFPHYDGKPAFFKGDLLVDEEGGKPLYCPPRMRLVPCPWYVRVTQDILRNPFLYLAPNPYTQRAGGTIHQITVAGRPLPVAAGGERIALLYMDQCYGTEPLGDASSFGRLRLMLNSSWPNATESPLTGNY